jgi:hypothetical protein
MAARLSDDTSLGLQLGRRPAEHVPDRRTPRCPRAVAGHWTLHSLESVAGGAEVQPTGVQAQWAGADSRRGDSGFIFSEVEPAEQ